MNIGLFNLNQELIKEIKEKLGDHNYEITQDLFLLKECITQESINLIITPLHDSNENPVGLELLKIVHASRISVPIIVISSNPGVSFAVDCIKLGAADYIEDNQNSDQVAGKISAIVKKTKITTEDKQKTNKPKLLFVDDNAEFTKTVAFQLGNKYNISSVNDFKEAEKEIEGTTYDCIFLDINDEINNQKRAGIELLEFTKEKKPEQPVIMLTSWAETAVAVECLKIGAIDFLEKSLKINETMKAIESAAQTILEKKNNFEKEKRIATQSSLHRVIDIIGESIQVKKLRKEIIEVASQDVPVLIHGETGTGKEMVAQALHTASSRYQENFIEIDCGSIPDSIFESELFGYTKGAFTGAAKDTKGKIELAHNGTLFLDEVENLSLEQQAKLLKVLEEKKIYPLGGNDSRSIDFRLICATNINLETLIADGKFREDLYYRLNVYNIELPPLRERGQDAFLLMKHFLNDYDLSSIDQDALHLLEQYPWPGNARELKNIIKKFKIISKHAADERISYAIVKDAFRRSTAHDNSSQLLEEIVTYYDSNIPAIITDLENRIIPGLYREFNGNISKIAKKVYAETPEDQRNHREKVRKVLERIKHNP